jgi:hypothetical protein
MRRILCTAALVLGVAALAVATASAAPPAPSFAAGLIDDGACLFTLGATWRNTQVDHVYGSWYLDGQFLLTTEAPGTGPNAGTLNGRFAVMQAGAFASTTDTHSWQVLVSFYDNGAQLAQVWTNVDTASCAVG